MYVLQRKMFPPHSFYLLLDFKLPRGPGTLSSEVPLEPAEEAVRALGALIALSSLTWDLYPPILCPPLHHLHLNSGLSL